MATALLRGLIQGGKAESGQLLFSSASGGSAEKLAAEYGGRAVSNREVLRDSELVFLCVKPAHVRDVLKDIDAERSFAPLISVVAGLSLAEICKYTAMACPVIRVMPNTPSRIGKGVLAYAMGGGENETTRPMLEDLFASLGKAFEVPENMFNAVTALSGSGPAYFYLMIEALIDGAVLEGMPRDVARAMAVQTALGSAAMLEESGEHPAVLRNQVTSPGGTTAAGLRALEEAGLRSAMLNAVEEAARRCRELSEPSSSE